MYRYWINVAKQDGGIYNDAQRYVHLFVTQKVQDEKMFKRQYAELSAAFPAPEYSIICYKQQASYVEVIPE